MPLVIAVAALKGGVGKTTATLNLGVALHKAGRRVILVDADGQRSLQRWAERAEEKGQDVPPVAGLSGTRLRKEIERIGERFEIAIIDCPPQSGTETRSAMLAADLVLIPTTPGATDTWSLGDTLALLADVRALRPEILARLLLNRAERTALTKVTQVAIEQSEIEGLTTVLHARVAYGEATAGGTGVVEYAPESDAAREVRRFTKEVVAVLNG